ncbi:MAG: alpha/beta hydrolase, partial [Spirochaetaceae bacterium]|nr:alpha/beta hydrolase [Spirochaetaceae bacterium]
MIANKLAGIAYEERGSGFPFVALHGYTLDRRMSIGAFEPLFDAAGRALLPPAAGSQRPRGGASARSYRRIYPDLPFMGESADLRPGAGSDDMLDALCAFIDEALPSGPFLIAGESYGGYIARGIARRMPERVEGAFFLCPLVVARREHRDLPSPAMLSEEPGWVSFA